MEGILFSKILHMSLIGCYCLIIVLLARIFLKKIGRKYCYYLWMIVFLNLCIPISVFSSFSLIPGQVQNFGIQNENLSEGNEQIDNTENSNVIFIRDSGTQIYTKSYQEVYPEKTRNRTVTSVTPYENQTFQWKQLLPLAEKIWLLGIAGFSVYSFLTAIRLNVRLKKSDKRSVKYEQSVVELRGLESPFLWGFLHPIIYLPMDIESEERRYIIAHEKCHRKRKDHLIKIAIYAVTVLHWFNPLVWLAYNLCCKDMEISCDEAVLENAGKNIRKDYAKSLLKYAAKQNRYVIAPLTFGEPSVRSRIENVLKYRKKGLVISVIAVLITLFVAVGLLVRPEESKSVENVSQSTEQAAGSIRLPVVNNGREIIKVGNNFYYKEGRPLYSNGKMIYTTNTNELEGLEYLFEYELDGSGFSKLMQGTFVGVNDSNEQFYFLKEEEDGETSFNVFDPYSMDVHQVYKRKSEFLTVADGYVYAYRKDADGLYLEINQISESHYEESRLEIPAESEVIMCLPTEKYLIFSAGSYEGSAGYFYGDFYFYDLTAKSVVKQIHLTDAGSFYAHDGYIYYQKYSNQGEMLSGLYRTDFELSDEELIGEGLEFLTIDKENGTILASKEGRLLSLSLDGKKQNVLFDLAEDAGWSWNEYDKAKFTEVNIIDDHIFVKVELWGYVEGNGWRDSLISSEYFQINSNGSGFCPWNPQSIAGEIEGSFGYLTERLLGSHVA